MLPSDAAIKIDKMNLKKKQDTITFCTNLSKKDRGPIYGNDQKRKESHKMSGDFDQKMKEPHEMSRDNDQKSCVYKKRKADPKSFFSFHSQK